MLGKRCMPDMFVTGTVTLDMVHAHMDVCDIACVCV